MSDDLFLCQVSKGSAVWSEFNIFLHLGYHGNGRHFEFFQPLKSCHILRWIFLQRFMKFDERNPNFFLNPPFFISMATAAKFVQPIPIFFGLSRSTRCGCFSYQVSSISVWRVTGYDHFCVFHFFLAFWPSPWQWQPFWKNQPLKAQLHMAYNIPTRFHKV